MPRFMLGGSTKNYDSQKSVQRAVNLVLEADPHGNYRAARRSPGLDSILTSLEGGIRSNFVFSPETNLTRTGLSVANKVVYFVAGRTFYEFSNDYGVDEVNAIGVIGGSGPCQVTINAELEVMITNGSGDAYNYSTSGVLAIQSNATNFLKPVIDVATFNTRYIFPQKNQNVFFLSDRGDGTTYSSLSRGAAEQQPDPLVATRTLKTYAWLIGTKSCELWQTFDDTDLPMRPVLGSTIMQGTQSYASVATLDENIAFLTDQGSVILISGAQWSEIADHELMLRIKGNGTLKFPGFSEPTDCYGYFIDDPIHPQYVLTFPTDNYTWCYDLKTKLPTTRESSDNYWAPRSSIRLNNKIIMGDNASGTLWHLNPQSFMEGSNTQKVTITSPSYSFDHDVFIPKIEIDMEVGKITGSSEPVLNVRYSKDGGNTWYQHSPVSLGKVGEYHKRVVIRDFGRLVRGSEFVLELSTTANCPIAFYGGDWHPEKSI